jgi:hypothetical protein
MSLEFIEINNDSAIFEIALNTAQEIFPVYTENILKLKYKFSDAIVKSSRISENHLDIERVSLLKIIRDYNYSTETSTDYIYFYQPANQTCPAEILMALIYAKLTGKKIAVFDWCDTFPNLSATGSAMFIVPYEHLDIQRHIVAVQDQTKMLCGFLPYENKLSLNFSLAKLLAVYNKQSECCKHLLINRISEKEDEVEKRFSASEEFYYFPKKYADLSNLEELLFKSSRLLEFNYLSHCRHCTLYFSDFYLCGLRQSNPATEGFPKKKYLPCCYYDPDKCSIENRKRKNASELNADIVFLNGCNLGDLNGSILPYRFNLVPNLIENNAVSIITSPSIKVGSEAENIFAYNLLKYGYTEGEKLFYINKFMEYSTIEDSLFFLIGDPCLKAVKTVREQFHMETVISGGNSFKVELSDISGHTLLYAYIPNTSDNFSYISNIHFTTECEEINQETAHIYYFQYNDKNTIRLFIFSNKPFQKGKVTINFTAQDEIKHKILRLKEHVENLNFYRNNFVLSNPIKGKLEDFQNNIKRIYTLQKACRYKVKILTETQDFLNKIEVKASRLYKEIFTAILEYTLNNKDNYYERISEKRLPVNGAKPDSKCISCGKSEYIYPYKLFSFEEEYFRSSLKCIECSIIRDVPDNKLVFYDYGTSKFEAEGTECEIIKIVNRHDQDIDISIAPVCLTSDKIAVEPASYTIRLKPDEGYIFKFKITPEAEILKHFYLFSFYVVADGKFYYYSKMLNHI